MTYARVYRSAGGVVVYRGCLPCRAVCSHACPRRPRSTDGRPAAAAAEAAAAAAAAAADHHHHHHHHQYNNHHHQGGATRHVRQQVTTLRGVHVTALFGGRPAWLTVEGESEQASGTAGGAHNNDETTAAAVLAAAAVAATIKIPQHSTHSWCLPGCRIRSGPAWAPGRAQTSCSC